MRALVVGGSGSGKSSYAERLCCRLSGERRYVATMRPGGAEAGMRIARHRAQRAGLGFRTLECPDARALGLAAGVRHGGVTLVDDLGNLVANELFSPTGEMAPPEQATRALKAGLLEIERSSRDLVVVGDIVGCEGPYAAQGTQAWVRLTGGLCCWLAARFDCVIEVVSGIPLAIKGEDARLVALALGAAS